MAVDIRVEFLCTFGASFARNLNIPELGLLPALARVCE